MINMQAIRKQHDHGKMEKEGNSQAKPKTPHS
jgi:hypothetical protein